MQRYLSRRNFLQQGLGASAAVMASGLANADGSNCRYVALPENFIYLNSGTEGSMPDCVMRQLQQNLNIWASDPTDAYETDELLGKRQVHNRRAIERFLRAQTNQVCLTDNTTMGLSLAITGLNFRSGDKVLTSNHEHNAIHSPLQVMQERSGIEVKVRSFPANKSLDDYNAAELLDYLFPNIAALRGARALCVSHVYPGTGVHFPLQLLREKADELKIDYLIVDGAQAFGMFDLTNQEGSANAISHTDFYACPGHKWLNGPPGTGILYLRNAKIRPPEFYPMLSQRMYKYADSTASYPMAQALQIRGCGNLPGFAALRSAVEYVERQGGVASAQTEILVKSKMVKDFIREYAPDCLISPYGDVRLHSGLSVFFPFQWNSPKIALNDKATADQVVHQLRQHNIQIRSIAIPRATGDGNEYALRVSTSTFNSTAQINIFKTKLTDVLSNL